MLKNLIILSLNFVPFFIAAQESPPIRPWVKKSSSIYVRMLGASWNVSIQDNTTVVDLKERILRTDGLRPEYQSINPFWKKWWALWLSEGHGPALDNNQNIKQIMSKLNTNLFEVRDIRQQK